MIPEVCWLGLHHGFFQGFWEISRGIWVHFLPGVWRGIWEFSANVLLTVGRVFSSGILGWCLGVSQPMALGASLGTLKGYSAGPLDSLLHNQAISPDTGLACRLRCVSNRHFLDTRRSTRWAEADFRATERRCGMRPDTHVRVLSTCFRRQGRLRDRRPPGGVDRHRHVWTLWE